MFKYFKIAILIFLLVLFIIPQTVSAFSLVPCGRSEDDPSTPNVKEDERCTLCHIFIMLQIIINGISIAILAWAAIFIVIGGITIMVAGGSPDKASQGKRMITYAIVGVVIAFGSWLIINITMNVLVDSDKMPWPWNKIECAPSSPVTHKECVDSACKDVEGEGKDLCISDDDCGVTKETNICRCEWQDTHVNTKIYSTPEECKNRCQSYCDDTFVGLDKYCCVENSNEQCKGDPLGVDEKKWCACETPVYSYSNQSSSLGKQLRSTELINDDTCTNQCKQNNYAVYCADKVLTDEATESNLYCVSENQLETIQAYCSNVEKVTDLEFFGFFSSREACMDSITPDNENVNSNYVRKCWIDGQLYCSCADRGVTGFRLYQTYKEESVGTYLSALSCLKNCEIVTKGMGSCHLGTFSEPKLPEEPKEEEDQWCERTAPAGSEDWDLNPPPGGAMDEQKGDASAQLTNFLNCMYDKIPELKINSISSNTLCDNPECDTSESGCGHSANSCHYGGTNCTGESYAVDFHTNIKCSDIEKAAKNCDSTAWVNWEYNHTHVSVNNRACGCNESAEGNPCP